MTAPLWSGVFDGVDNAVGALNPF